MNRNEAKKLRLEVLLSLQPNYEKHGFAMKTRAATFEKAETIIHWGPTRTFPDALIFRPWLRVENKEIKKVLKILFPSELAFNTIVRTQGSEFAHDMDIHSLDNSSFNYRDENGSSYYYRVESNTDLSAIVVDHFRFMNLVGFPFIDKLSTLSGIDNFINNRVLAEARPTFLGKEYQAEVRQFFDKREVLSGVIVAHLLNNPNLEELLIRYQNLFEGNSYILDDVEKIIKYFASPN